MRGFIIGGLKFSGGILVGLAMAVVAAWLIMHGGTTRQPPSPFADGGRLEGFKSFNRGGARLEQRCLDACDEVSV
ncbi:hypothetical protein [Phenylobacterium sp.]|jgi:hypothetical protein|uniref:hypothetical protein n=1 Tax=Phenylobacterium sp. TaxID=1871053 RepID=UPI00378338BC